MSNTPIGMSVVCPPTRMCAVAVSVVPVGDSSSNRPGSGASSRSSRRRTPALVVSVIVPPVGRRSEATSVLPRRASRENHNA
jgi:hypothetical protein